MNKRGHIVITGSIIETNSEIEKKIIILGSIMPDILVHTYLKGHTWEKMNRKILNKIENFSEWGSFNIISCLTIGWILHYVEDFFTMPHNPVFQGSVKEHVAYEKRLTTYLLNPEQKYEINKPATQTEFRNRMENLHNEYLRSEMSVQNDVKYISIAVRTVYSYLLPSMKKNQQLYQLAINEAASFIAQNHGTI